MANSSRYDKGRKVFTEVVGFEPPASAAGDPFLELTVANLFGDIWGREGLPRRDRRLITIVIVTCLMQREYLKLHLKAALDNGEFSVAELKEIMLHITHYAGWPVGSIGTAVVQEVANSEG